MSRLVIDNSVSGWDDSLFSSIKRCIHNISIPDLGGNVSIDNILEIFDSLGITEGQTLWKVDDIRSDIWNLTQVDILL